MRAWLFWKGLLARNGTAGEISNKLAELEDPHEVTNKVLMYLLGKDDDPAVAKVLHQFYERSVFLSKQWILIEQRHGVIQDTVDPDKTAEMFVLFSFGLRVRASFSGASTIFTVLDAAAFMANILKK